MRLYFNFSSQLMFYTSFFKLCFKQYFQCKNKFTLLFTRQVHISKFPFPQRTTNFKIIKRPLSSAKGEIVKLQKLIPACTNNAPVQQILGDLSQILGFNETPPNRQNVETSDKILKATLWLHNAYAEKYCHQSHLTAITELCVLSQAHFNLLLYSALSELF